MNALLSAAQRAFDETEFYSGLYELRPDDDQQIPFISHSDYHRASGLLDCITDRSEVSGYLPAYHRNIRKFPFNIIESDVEQKQRHDRLMHCLDILDIDSGQPSTYLIIADDASGPFAGEISTCLAWEHNIASIVFHHSNLDQLLNDIKSCAPDYIIKVSNFSWQLDLREYSKKTITVLHVDYPIPVSCRLAFLACDEIGVFAARKNPEDLFSYNEENLLIETNPLTRLPALTTVNFGIAPFIRYCPSQFKIPFNQADV